MKTVRHWVAGAVRALAWIPLGLSIGGRVVARPMLDFADWIEA